VYFNKQASNWVKNPKPGHLLPIPKLPQKKNYNWLNPYKIADFTGFFAILCDFTGILL
jgi:hypothetical protein